MKIIFFAFFVALMTGCASVQPPIQSDVSDTSKREKKAIALSGAQESQGVAQAELAAQLFFKVCVGSFGRSSIVEATAKQNGLVELPENVAQKDLMSGKGKVWDASNDIGKFYLQLDSNGLCSVRANKADASYMKEKFREMLPLSVSGWEVKKTIDRMQIDSGVYSLGYDVSQPQSPTARRFLLSTNEGKETPIQAIISLIVVTK